MAINIQSQLIEGSFEWALWPRWGRPTDAPSGGWRRHLNERSERGPNLSDQVRSG